MLASFSELLTEARAHRRAVGAFTVYTLEQASGVLAAAAEGARPVVLLISSATFRSAAGRELVRALRALAAGHAATCCLQLDHEHDLAVIDEALREGVGAVMADGSRLPFSENLQLVQAAVGLAHRRGAAVEAELGQIGGEEERATAAARGALTDPEQALELMATTAADCLAVSIGNVHGDYPEPPTLDLERLERIAGVVDKPLALHGASGLTGGQLSQTIERGIAKVNVNTELRRAYLDTILADAPTLAEGARLLALTERLRAATAAVVAEKLAELELTR